MMIYLIDKGLLFKDKVKIFALSKILEIIQEKTQFLDKNKRITMNISKDKVKENIPE